MHSEAAPQYVKGLDKVGLFETKRDSSFAYLHLLFPLQGKIIPVSPIPP